MIVSEIRLFYPDANNLLRSAFLPKVTHFVIFAHAVLPARSFTHPLPAFRSTQGKYTASVL